MSCMKKILIIIVAAFLQQQVSAQLLSRLIQEPVSGEELTIVYNTTGTMLENVPVEATAYYYDSVRVIKEEKYTLHKEGPYRQTVIKIPAGTVLIHLVFGSTDGGITDNNNGNGYLLPVYINGRPARYALSMMSTLAEGIPLDKHALKKDPKRSLAYIKEELLYHPSGEEKFRRKYWSMLGNSPELDDKELLIKKILAFKSDKEEDMMTAQIYLSYLGSTAQADSLDKLLVQKFPHGEYVKRKKVQEQPEKKTVSTGPPVSGAAVLSVAQIKEIRSGMINEPAPSITLKDIHGNNVSIGEGDLKGKVIVIDFWATWCKPCIASFPAIKRVMEKYRTNANVKFLFICTMEKGDPVKNVREFIDKNPYPFTILIDEKEQTGNMNLYKAFTSYKVEGGIPYKIVLDKKGAIRFRSGGFSGNENDLVNELSAMIELAAAG